MADNTFFLYNFSLKPGHSIEVEGFIPKDCKRFFINLGTDDKNIVIHFDSRFDHGKDKLTIVLNSMVDGVYGGEQRESSFPFQEASNTKICFKFEQDKILIELPTGNPLSFPVRFPIEEISYLEIENLKPKLIRLK